MTAMILWGGTFEHSSDGVTFANVPGVTQVNVPEEKRDYVEVTNLDSPGGAREYIPGLRDVGEITITANYSRAGYVAQRADQASGNAIYYRVTFSNGDAHEFMGFPTVSAVTSGLGDPITMSIGIRVTGDASFAAGA